MVDTVADADERMASERIGRVLGEWKLERLIGVGGMAAVYAARGKDGKVAALKVLHPEMCRRVDIRQRFAQEGTAASRVGHPGVVAVLGNGEDTDGTAFLVLELLEGDTLNSVLKREGAMPLPRLLDIIDQVLDVLAAAHERGIVHRDLKPDNLFITPDGKVKVLDFGIARVLDDVPGAYKTRTGITLGTVPFMSPEQALGKRAQVDGRSDIFSLGAMMFRILAGRHVHTAETDAELLVAMASKPAPALTSVAPAVTPALGSVVDLALAFSKDSRYPDARTMQTDVRAVKAGSAPPHATKVLSSREMATRTDLPVPAISMVAGQKGATIPEATAATGPDGALSAAPAGERAPGGVLMTPTVPDQPAFTVADTQAPASFRGADLARLQRVDPEQAIATAATTVENPAFAAQTAKMVTPPDGRTITSTPPKKRGWVVPALIGTVAVAALAGGGFVALSQSGSSAADPNADPSAAAATALPAGAVTEEPAAAAAAAPTEQGATNQQPANGIQPAKQVFPGKPAAPGAPTTTTPGAATGAAPAPTSAPTNPSPGATPATPPPASPATAPAAAPTTAPASPPPATAPATPPAASPSPTTAPAPPPPSPTTAPPSPPPSPTTAPASPPAPTTTPAPAPSPSSKSKRGRDKNR